MKASLQSFSPARWFYLFIVIHVLCWSLAPILIRYNLPLDAIEGSVWGHQLEWGYDKNPFLNAWLTALASAFSEGDGWLIYVFSQLSVAASLWVVWQLGKNMFDAIPALIAVMLLEGMQYFNFHAIDFNDNTLELGLWALTTLFFYRALTDKTHTSFHWLATSFFAALGMMTKYYTAVLLTAMGLFLLWDPINRQQLKSIPPYLGLLLFAIMITPHLIWLSFHDFITVQYVFARTSSTPHWSNHINFPLQFTWEQLQVFAPSLFLFLLFFIGKPNSNSTASDPSFNRQFLYFIALGPLALTLLLSILFGIKLRAGWGMPLLTFWPLLLFAMLPVCITRTRLYLFIMTIFILLAGLVTGYSWSLLRSDTPSSANFPGQELARMITSEWHHRYHTQLPYVAGSRWLGGNISFYSKDHPAVFMDWDLQRAPWIDVQQLKRDGAIFIWNISRNEILPPSVQAQFPNLESPVILELDWQRNTYGLAPLKIGVAFLPPQPHPQQSLAARMKNE